MRKLDNFIKYDEEIDISEILAEINGHNILNSKLNKNNKLLNTKYELTGIVVHQGSLKSGH